MNKSLDDLLYEHCEDLTDVQHIKFRTQLEAYIQVEANRARTELPDLIKGVTVSGVAVPRQELNKISLQDLRLVIEELNKEV